MINGFVYVREQWTCPNQEPMHPAFNVQVNY